MERWANSAASSRHQFLSRQDYLRFQCMQCTEQSDDSCCKRHVLLTASTHQISPNKKSEPQNPPHHSYSIPVSAEYAAKFSFRLFHRSSSALLECSIAQHLRVMVSHARALVCRFACQLIRFLRADWGTLSTIRLHFGAVHDNITARKS